MAKGIEKGRAEGMAKGIEKGRAEGMAKGRAEERARFEANLRAMGLSEEAIAQALKSVPTSNCSRCRRRQPLQ